MIQHLIELTNSSSYLLNYTLLIEKVITYKTVRQQNVKILIRLIDERRLDEPNYKEEIWHINCLNVKFLSNNVHEPKPSYKRINIYDKHPLLLSFSDEALLTISGNFKNALSLLSDLIKTNYLLTGDWLNFMHYFSSIYRTIPPTNRINIRIPLSLANDFKKIFTEYSLEVEKECVLRGLDETYKVLIFGNYRNVPDTINFYQSAIVAEKFEVNKII